MIIRHDVSEDRYLASPDEFAAIGAFTPDGDHACLIDPWWLFTAAHVAMDVDRGAPVTMNGGQLFHVDRVVLHPGFSDEPTENDIALVQTSTVISGIAPLLLYDHDDGIGRIATFVGRGDFGNGHTGSVINDGRLRRAENRAIGITEQWIKFRFDPPGSADALDLEGISGDGDSGGPALIQTDSNGYRLAGISSWQADAGQEGRYGVIEHYVRVSRYLDWIRSVVPLID